MCSNYCKLHTHALTVASIPGQVFAFITVRRTTGPGTSCLRMRQSDSDEWIFSFTFVTFIFVYYRVLEVSSRFIIIGIDWNGS